MPELDLAVRFKAEVDEAGHLAAVINDLFRGYTVSVLDEDTVKQSRFKDIYENTRAEFWKNKNISRQKSGFNQKLPSMDVISKIIKIATADIKKQALKMIKDEDAKKIEQIKAEIMATKK